jgi:hypothetical protein
MWGFMRIVAKALPHVSSFTLSTTSGT